MPETCISCGREVRGDIEICATCNSPEAQLERISHLPEPIRGVMLRVGRDFGIVDKEETDQSDRKP